MLICSDGLTTEVSDERITQILAAEPDPQRRPTFWSTRPCRRAGRDNITVVIVDAVSVAARRGALLQADDVDADTRPREAAAGGVR